MLINSIDILNFRVFAGHQHVDFSTDADKNVTIILADNGTGKTTIAQAFSWCLYGKTTFKKANDLLSFSVRDSLEEGRSAKVEVSLSISHKGTEYFITRSQEYRKDGVSKISPNSPVLHVSYKQADGQTQYIDNEKEKEDIINEIMPDSISSYFFFDGERVEKMGNEIQDGRSDEFKTAVDNLLGLSAISEAIRHLKGSSSMVIGSYNKDYNENSDQEYQKAEQAIEAAERRIGKLNEQIKALNDSKANAAALKEKYNSELSKGRETKNLALERQKLQDSKRREEEKKERSFKAVKDNFSRQAWGFFAAPLLRSALKTVESSSIEIKEAPHGVDADTIRDILKRETCLCGTHIEAGSKESQALNAWLKIVPPEHIGAALKNYRSSCEPYLNGDAGLTDDIQVHMQSIYDSDDLIAEQDNRISEIDAQLAGAKDMSQVENLYQAACRNVRDIDEKINKANLQIGMAEATLRESRQKRDSLVTNDSTNRRVRRDRDYAECIFNAFNAEHSRIEGETRRDLEVAINDIFKEFFNGSLELFLDGKYNVQVKNKDSENAAYDVETSEGQTVAVIFAFIAGVIRLATDAERKADEMLLSEAYPLVMDAPMSKLDKKRIASVCSVMPKIAEQVVIMIKDTDGELAHEYLKDKIGYQYEVIPFVPERESRIERRDA